MTTMLTHRGLDSEARFTNHHDDPNRLSSVLEYLEYVEAHLADLLHRDPCVVCDGGRNVFR